jgi:hypothetical protein
MHISSRLGAPGSPPSSRRESMRHLPFVLVGVDSTRRPLIEAAKASPCPEDRRVGRSVRLFSRFTGVPSTRVTPPPPLAARDFSITAAGALAFIAGSPLGVGARSERDMLTSRTSARLPAFALALRLADRRRLRSSSSSAAESERARLRPRPSATSEPRRDGAFERFRLGASLGVAGRSRSNSSSEKTACGNTLLRRRVHISCCCEANLVVREERLCR